MTELGEAEAWLDMYTAAPPDVAGQLGLRAEQVGSATVAVIAGLKAALLNHVAGLGMAEPATEDMLDRIAAIYRQAEVPYELWMSPLAHPAGLPNLLATRGLRPAFRSAKLYRGVEAPPEIPTDLRIEKIGPDHGQTFGELLCRGFDLPPFLAPWIAATVGRDNWLHYMAFEGEQAVATGALFAWDGVGWLGMAATLRSHRRRGAQGAIMARRILDSTELGCTLLTTDTGEETPEYPNSSYHNMMRTGFNLLYVRDHYASRQ